MHSGIAAYVIHVRSEIERYQIAKERKKAINVKSQGKWQVISYIDREFQPVVSLRFINKNVFSLFVYVQARSATRTPWNRVVNQGKLYEILK